MHTIPINQDKLSILQIQWKKNGIILQIYLDYMHFGCNHFYKCFYFTNPNCRNKLMF